MTRGKRPTLIELRAQRLEEERKYALLPPEEKARIEERKRSGQLQDAATEVRNLLYAALEWSARAEWSRDQLLREACELWDIQPFSTEPCP